MLRASCNAKIVLPTFGGPPINIKLSGTSPCPIYSSSGENPVGSAVYDSIAPWRKCSSNLDVTWNKLAGGSVPAGNVSKIFLFMFISVVSDCDVYRVRVGAMIPYDCWFDGAHY